MNPRWYFEEHCVSRMIQNTLQKDSTIDSFMDIPIGTNRLHMLIEGHPNLTRALGVDYSDDMLTMAASKQTQKYSYEKHDIFTGPFNQKTGIVLCLRFLNLFDWPSARKAIRNLSNSTEKYIILSIRLVDDDYNGKPVLENKIHLHKEALFYEAINADNLIVDSKECYEDTKQGTYCIFLLKHD